MVEVSGTCSQVAWPFHMAPCMQPCICRAHTLCDTWDMAAHGYLSSALHSPLMPCPMVSCTGCHVVRLCHVRMPHAMLCCAMQLRRSSRCCASAQHSTLTQIWKVSRAGCLLCCWINCWCSVTLMNVPQCVVHHAVI